MSRGAPRSQARYGVDYSLKVVALGPVTLTVDSSGVGQAVDVVSERIEDDGPAMRQVAGRMVTMVRENLLTGQFTPILAETVERRKYPFRPANGIGTRSAVGGSQPLVAGRSLLNGIVARSKTGYAAAQRGAMEWYGFLQNEGVGRVDRRTFMEIKSGQADELVRIYDEWQTEVVEGGFA